MVTKILDFIQKHPSYLEGGKVQECITGATGRTYIVRYLKGLSINYVVSKSSIFDPLLVVFLLSEIGNF